jgi:hypothetical protein
VSRTWVFRVVLGVAVTALLVLSPWAFRQSSERPLALSHFTATPDGDPDSVGKFEQYWNDRLTYPTGKFNPGWLRKAAEEDSKVPRGVPGGKHRGNGNGNGSGNSLSKAFASSLASTTSLPANSFVALGPAPERMTGCVGCFDYSTTSGRINAIVVDPTTTTNGSIVAYAASVGGGVWKTTNCCSASTTWTVTTDNPLISAIDIDTLAIDPNDHNTVYAGTGDLNYGSFSMGSQGILKSTDAGATWTVKGANVFGPALTEPAGQFPQYDAVGKVRVDPNNSNRVAAGTKKGLYLSYDGGNNWTGPCTTNGFSSQRQDITGLELSNMGGGTTRIIAAVGVRGFATPVQFNLDQNGANGIYKATMPASGCPSFTSIASNANGFVFGTAVSGSAYPTGANMNAGSGAPFVSATSGNQVGRIDIGVAPSNPNVIYAQVQSIVPNVNSGGSAGCGGAAGCQIGAWASTDGGGTWSFMAGSAGGSLKACGTGAASSTTAAGDYPQNWYDQGVAVDPNNPDRVFFDTFEVWLATRTGTAWYDTTCGYSGVNPKPVHVDQHALAFVSGSSSMLLAGNDGGVHGTINANAAAPETQRPTWFNMDTGFNTIEYYAGDISPNFATAANPYAAGGAQDNMDSFVTFSGTPTGPVQWQGSVGGDGFYARLDGVGGYFYASNNAGALHRCTFGSPTCTGPGSVWSGDIRATTPRNDRQSFVMPFDLFKGNPGGSGNAECGARCNHIMLGTFRVWETVNSDGASSVTWTARTGDLTKNTLGNRSYINQLHYSPANQTLGIVATNDGNVQVIYGLGGAAGSAGTPVNLTGGNAVLPNRPILDATFDPRSDNTVANPMVGYAAVGGFNANTPATPGHLFQVTCNVNCASFSWLDKTGNLPDIPVDSVVANPNYPQQVYAGTDFGFYFTNDITAATPLWQKFTAGIPSTMIWHLQIDRGNTTLSAWTRSRGAYVWSLPTAPFALDQTITFPPITDKVYGTADFDPGATASSGLPVSYTASGSCTIVSNKVHLTGVGSCTVTAHQAGDVNWNPAPDVMQSFNITAAPTTLTLTVPAVQYSDPVTLTATITPNVPGNPPTGTVQFYVDGVSVGSASVNASGQASVTTTITKAPGSYPVTATFTSTSPDYSSSSGGPTTLTVTQEDARATYNGNGLFWTSSSSSDTANVVLSAAVQDITAADPTASPPNPDTYPGDIQNAKVTFVLRPANTPIPGCSNLNVGLVNAGDTQTGLATCSSTLTLPPGTPSGGDQFTIGIVVSGYYTRNSSADDAIVTVAQPQTSNFITGGGYIVLTDSAGLVPGTDGTRASFGFNAKFNRPGTNQQGHVMVMVRSGGHVYQIKGTNLSSLGVTGNTGNLTSKANIQDVTDPNNPVSVDGNATLQLSMTDNGEPGSSDTIGIQVINKQGGLWFSSNWNGTSTVEQVLAGGNLSVH